MTAQRHTVTAALLLACLLSKLICEPLEHLQLQAQTHIVHEQTTCAWPRLFVACHMHASRPCPDPEGVPIDPFLLHLLQQPFPVAIC